jgi:hypothetical protein
MLNDFPELHRVFALHGDGMTELWNGVRRVLYQRTIMFRKLEVLRGYKN